jgi:hypothetical protein
VAGFDAELLKAVAREREVTLTTRGRSSGRSHTVTIWIATDGEHVYIRSGDGLKRHWPQNFLTHGEATLHVAGRSVKVLPRHIGDAAEARAISHVVRGKYGDYVKPSRPPEPLTAGEQATFELIPAG